MITGLIGEYIPQKDINGKLLPRQCWGSTGTCWCEFSIKKEYFRMDDPRDCPEGN
tara:strand:+ start:2533 stop:2697 length:165 start_codon:yes stop_codon:yes gene_type:complete